MATKDSVKERIARQAGLPDSQMRTFDDLDDEDKKEVEWLFGLYNADAYLYAVKEEGGLVSRRWKLPRA